MFTRRQLKSKFIVVALLLASFSFVAQAQFEADKNYLGPSIGLSFLGSTPQFGANYERAIKVDFGMLGIGGIFRYWSYSENFLDGKWKYTNILIGAQGNYHFKVSNDKFDPWAGLTLAYDGGSVSADGIGGSYASPTVGGLFLGLQGGGRYFFTPSLAGVVRVSFGSLSYGGLDVGVDWKF